ncbi:hypothetical protein NKH77_54520 [Streptomyces sp. M19]
MTGTAEPRPGPERRSVLKAGAAAVVGGAALTGTDSAAAAGTGGGSPGGTRHGVVRAVDERVRKAPSGRWDTFNLSPARRTVRPVAVRTTTGTVERAQELLGKHGAARTRLVGRGVGHARLRQGSGRVRRRGHRRRR